jgi:RimJ/RimL family protein N-acetyltransferase
MMWSVAPVLDVPAELHPFERPDAASLVAFLSGQDWPFHGTVRERPEDIQERINAGRFDDDAASRAFWIVVAGDRVGMVRLFDLEDETPMFDLRIDASHRGKGFGKAALRLLTGRVFAEWPGANRIEATTRQDNVAMRATFAACGYAKEAHYREAWHGNDGRRYDAVGYAILRRDWSTGAVTPVAWDD